MRMDISFNHNKMNGLALFLLYIGINCLFIAKYVSRIDCLLTVGGCMFYLIVMTAIACFANKGGLTVSRKRYGRIGVVLGKYYAIIVVCVFVLLIIGQACINPYQINVDRWSAIHNFISELLEGRFPYKAETHLHGYGSPFPVWQILHIPFYLLGNVGLSFSVGTFLFLHSMYRLWGTRVSFIAFILLIASPAYLYR